MTVPMGTPERRGSLGVAEPGHVDRGDRVAPLLGQGGHHLEDLARGNLLHRRGGCRRRFEAPRRLDVERHRRAAGARTDRVDPGVAQHAEEIRQRVLRPGDLARPAQHPLVGLLHQILGVLAGAGQGPGRAEEAIEVIAEACGLQLGGHATSVTKLTE